MSWFKDKRVAAPGTAPSDHSDRQEKQPQPRVPHLPHDVEAKLAQFLVSHDRLQTRTGRPLMHLLGVAHNQHDGTIDYAIRSRVHDSHGKDRRFDSTIRMYPSGHLRLVR